MCPLRKGTARPPRRCPYWQVAEKSDVIFIAVKPQYVGTVLKEMKGQMRKETIIVSIAAGVPLAAMKVRLPLSASRLGTV